MLNVNQHIAGYSGLQRKRLLREPAVESQLTNALTHCSSVLRPEFGALRVCLAGSGWHAPSTLQRNKKVCPTSITCIGTLACTTAFRKHLDTRRLYAHVITNSQERSVAAAKASNRSGSETRQRNRDCNVRLLEPEAEFLERLAFEEGLSRQQLFLREWLWPRMIAAGIDVSDAW
jgi:hypothetical protein